MAEDVVEAFNRRGYAGPFTLYEPELAAKLLRRLQEEVFPFRSEIYEHTTADPRTAAFRKTLDPECRRDRHLDSPLLHRIATAPEIISRLARVIGPDVLLWRSDTFEQAAGDRLTDPHQDAVFDGMNPVPMIEAGPGQVTLGRQMYPVETDIPLSVNAWITFSQVRKETGALWFVPGTHKTVIPYVKGEGVFGRPMVMSRTFDPSEGHMIEMEAGQFMLFNNLVVHASHAVEQGSRLAWTPRYTSTETLLHRRSNTNAQFMDLSRYGAVLVHGQDRLRNNVMRSPPTLSGASILEERALVNLGYRS